MTLLLALKRSWQPHGQISAKLSTRARNIGWEAWEDKVIKDYIGVNGAKWTDLVQHCLPHKTANSCQMRWETVLKPTLKRGPLSPLEVDQLRKGVEEIGVGQWKKIAEQYLPGRSTHQLHSAWVTCIDPSLVKRKAWTPEEDEKLCQGVEQYGFGQWTKIKHHWLPHRPHTAIRNRYVNNLDPTLRPIDWTTDELDILLRRTVIFGSDNWQHVAEGLEGRSPAQCRRKYLRHIDPSRTQRGSVWTRSEIELFWELVRIHSGRWKEISKYLGRTEEECLAQFTAGLNQELKLLYPEEQTSQRKDESRPDWKRRIGILMAQHLSRNLQARIASNQSLVLVAPPSPPSPSSSTSEGGGDRKRVQWTTEESERLEQLVKEHGSNWNLIAKHHGTKTAQQCGNRYRNVIRYRQDLTPYLHNDPLTQAEKDRIVQGVDMFGHDWTAITKTYLPQRKPHQCMRWYLANMESTLPGGKGRWTEEEDERLKFAMDQYKDDNDNNKKVDWVKVARLVYTGRTPLQCRQHWYCYLDPSISKKGPWDWDEKLQLVELVQTNQMATDLDTSKASFWEHIAKTLNTGRSAWSCRMKYAYMVRTDTLFKS